MSSSLKQELKELIIDECQKDCSADDIRDDEVLFESNVLSLDSMDALQISMAINKKYGIKTTDSKELRKIMYSIDTLASYIQKNG